MADFREPSAAEARRIISRCSRGAIAYVHGRGYRWVTSTFLPCLKRLSRERAMRDRELAADGFYLLGDIYDFNQAPLAAIRAYRQCLKLDPAAAAAWREIGGMYDRLGDRRKARAA